MQQNRSIIALLKNKSFSVSLNSKIKYNQNERILQVQKKINALLDQISSILQDNKIQRHQFLKLTLKSVLLKILDKEESKKIPQFLIKLNFNFKKIFTNQNVSILSLQKNSNKIEFSQQQKQKQSIWSLDCFERNGRQQSNLKNSQNDRHIEINSSKKKVFANTFFSRNNSNPFHHHSKLKINKQKQNKISTCQSITKNYNLRKVEFNLDNVRQNSRNQQNASSQNEQIKSNCQINILQNNKSQNCSINKFTQNSMNSYKSDQIFLSSLNNLTQIHRQREQWQTLLSELNSKISLIEKNFQQKTIFQQKIKCLEIQVQNLKVKRLTFDKNILKSAQQGSINQTNKQHGIPLAQASKIYNFYLKQIIFELYRSDQILEKCVAEMSKELVETQLLVQQIKQFQQRSQNNTIDRNNIKQLNYSKDQNLSESNKHISNQPQSDKIIIKQIQSQLTLYQNQKQLCKCKQINFAHKLTQNQKEITVKLKENKKKMQLMQKMIERKRSQYIQMIGLLQS